MSWRQQLLPTVDALLEPVGLYAAYELDDREFVGRAEYLPLGKHDATEVLLESGYERYERLREHYRPTWGMAKRDDVTYILGACDDVVAGLLDVDAAPDRK